MNNPPAFQFYPKDFLSDANVEAMTLEEVGAYTKLLCLCWIEDGIPIKTAEKLVERWLPNGSTKGQPNANLWPKIKHCFYEKGGKYRNKRLDLERQKQIVWSEKSREGGLKSGETRRLTKGGSTKREPSAKQRRTKPQASSLQSSLSSLQSSIKDILSYLNRKTGKNFSSETENTQKLISGRFAKHRTIDDFKKVIDIKVAEWMGTEWEKYLRPSTLFNATKFEEYLNQKPTPVQVGVNVHSKSPKDLEWEKAQGDYLKKHPDREGLAEFSQQWHEEHP